MKSIRKTMAAVLAVVMAATMLLMSGCSTPKIAMTVDGRQYTTGEYLAALYENFSYAYYDSGLYQYAAYGMDPWAQTYPYGEEGAQVEMRLADYLVQMTKDNIIRQTAVKKLMEQYGITVPEEDINELKESLADVKESEMLQYGFSRESYIKTLIAASLEEQELFYSLYGEGGQREVSDADVRAYFDANFIAYKAITISQMDSEGNALADADKQANHDKLNTYLELYNEKQDFDAVIEQYEADEAAASTTTTTTTTAAGATTTTNGSETAATTTTTAAPTTTALVTTTTTAATTTTVSGETTTTTTGTGETTEQEEETDPNLVQANTVTGDEKLIEAFKEAFKDLEAGSVKIVEYTDSNDQTYVALVQWLDVEETGGEGYYDDQKETCLYGMKFEEFDAEVKTVIEQIEPTVVYDDRAISMCDPKNFVPEE